MSTTYSTNVGLAKPARADRNWDIQLNANVDALDKTAALGSLATTTTETPSVGLRVKVAPGRFRKSDGTLGSFAGAPMQAVPGSATTFLWLTDAGALATGPSYPSGVNIVRLAQVVAGVSTITSVVDQRAPWISVGAAAPNGTVTSVGLALPSDWSVSNAPVTTAGVLTATRTNQTANTVMAGPSVGSPAVPSYRALVGADLPVFGPSGLYHAPGAVPDPGSTAGSTRFLREDGTWNTPAGGSGGTGSVTSVGVSMPAPFLVMGSPITGSGTITVSWPTTLTANQVLASPATGSGPPSFRTMVASDYPVFGASGASHAPGAVPDPGATTGSTRFLREDGTWSAPAGGGGGGGSTTQTLAITTPSSYPYTCTSTDSCILVNSSAARTVSLPAASVAGTGRVYQVKDATGAAATNSVTINVVSGGGTIDGSTYTLITNNYGEAQFISDGANWQRLYNRADLADGNFTVSKKLTVSGCLNLAVATYTTSTFTMNPNVSVNLIRVMSMGPVTANLPAAATIGANLVVVVKDAAGTAGMSNINITPNGSDTIDGSSFSKSITTGYGVVRLLCDGVSAWYTL